MWICPSNVIIMHNGPAILLIFLLCYVVQSLCTHIALKLPNAKGVDSFMDRVTDVDT